MALTPRVAEGFRVALISSQFQLRVLVAAGIHKVDVVIISDTHRQSLHVLWHPDVEEWDLKTWIANSSITHGM